VLHAKSADLGNLIRRGQAHGKGGCQKPAFRQRRSAQRAGNPEAVRASTSTIVISDGCVSACNIDAEILVAIHDLEIRPAHMPLHPRFAPLYYHRFAMKLDRRLGCDGPRRAPSGRCVNILCNAPIPPTALRNWISPKYSNDGRKPLILLILVTGADYRPCRASSGQHLPDDKLPGNLPREPDSCPNQLKKHFYSSMHRAHYEPKNGITTSI